MVGDWLEYKGVLLACKMACERL